MTTNQKTLILARELLPSVVIRYGTEEFMTRVHAEEIVNEAILLADAFLIAKHELMGGSYDDLQQVLKHREPD
jgi:hypothetical protein